MSSGRTTLTCHPRPSPNLVWPKSPKRKQQNSNYLRISVSTPSSIEHLTCSRSKSDAFTRTSQTSSCHPPCHKLHAQPKSETPLLRYDSHVPMLCLTFPNAPSPPPTPSAKTVHSHPPAQPAPPSHRLVINTRLLTYSTVEEGERGLLVRYWVFARWISRIRIVGVGVIVFDFAKELC